MCLRSHIIRKQLNKFSFVFKSVYAKRWMERKFLFFKPKEITAHNAFHNVSQEERIQQRGGTKFNPSFRHLKSPSCMNSNPTSLRLPCTENKMEWESKLKTQVKSGLKGKENMFSHLVGGAISLKYWIILKFSWEDSVNGIRNLTRILCDIPFLYSDFWLQVDYYKII